MPILPKSRPGASADLVQGILRKPYKAPIEGPPTYCDEVPPVPEKYKLAVLNVRGYYRDTMGKPLVNDVGIYDDAAFLVTPDGVTSFNANTDPSVIGWNSELGKPYAMLDQGLHYFIRGLHKGSYAALRQPYPEQAEAFSIANHGHFPIIRDNGKGKRYLDEGYHAINYHRGGNNGTSSWGCQTIPPEQYDEFIHLVYHWMTRINQKVCPVMLINGPIN